MKINEIIKEGRTDALNLPILAKRHFGPNTSVNQNGDQTIVVPEKRDRAAMLGFMSEVKRLGMEARWEPSADGFVVT